MSTIRRFAYAAFGVACTHLVFGAIVRISGSGMGCGPHWPKCYGRWFPPFERPDLVIEVMHRYLASVLLLSLIALAVASWRRRAEPGVGGRGGVLRMALLAVTLGFSAALLGAVTVKLGNTPLATVAHWTVAMSLVAAVAAAVVRAGGLGGAAARAVGTSAKTRRATFVAAAMALVAVVMGGLTAKVPGGSVACLSFPLCGANPDVARGAVHVQSTHRLIAVLLVLHLVGLFFALRKRGEAPVIRRFASVAMGLGVLQLLVAGAMIGMKLPPVLRSLHEATGVSIWVATFVLAYLARLARGDAPDLAARAPEPPATPSPAPRPVAAREAPAPAAASPAVVAGPLAPSSSAPPAGPVMADVIATGAVALPPEVATDVAPRALQPRPVTPAATRVVATPVAAPAPRARPDEPMELPAAIERGTRTAAAAALGFHLLAARAVAVEVADAWAASAMALECPPPPMGEVATRAPEAADDFTARATIFDTVAPADEVDDLYNLRELEAVDDDDAAPADAPVATLDEEFSRLALEVAACQAAPAEGRQSSLTAIAALRRPAMSHSVAVIVARGADV